MIRTSTARHAAVGAALLAAWVGVACQDRPREEPVASSEESTVAIPAPDPPPTEWRVLEAISEATATVASDPSSAIAWGKLGAVLDAHSYFPEAARCYRQALRLAPDDFRWSYHLAVTLDREAGDVEEVATLFARASRAEPRYPPVYYRLGAALQRHGRYAEAREAFERVLELDPELATARRQLGQVLLALGETEAALAELERAVARNPNDGSAHSALAQAYARLGQTERARAAAGAARRSSPETGLPDPVRYEVSSLGVSGFLAYKRGQSALEAGRLDEAIALFLIKDEVNPSASNDYFLGLSHQRAGRLDAAARYFEKAIARNGHADSHWQLGELLIERGRTASGLDHLRRAAGIPPRPPQGDAAASGSHGAGLLHGVGASLARHGELEDAIAAFAGAGRLDPSNSSLEADWCGALLQLGRTSEALVHCEKAVRLDESSARAHFHLGLALELSDRAADAHRHYERAVELDPTSRARERLRSPRP